MSSVTITDPKFHQNVADVYGDRPADTPHPTAVQVDVRALYRQAVEEVATKAREALPQSNGRIEAAVKLVLAGDVELLPDGKGKVASQSNGKVKYFIVNGECKCLDFPKAPQSMCKHRIAYGIAKRAKTRTTELLDAATLNSNQGVTNIDTPATLSISEEGTAEVDCRAHAAPTQAVAPLPPAETPDRVTTSSPIPPQFITMIHGKAFVQFAGLLAMAHARGLVSLSAHFLSVTPELATAEATAEFADGKTFLECGDATPDNVNVQVRKHFARCALTRAKSRALRDALNVSMCSVEEMEV